MAGIGQKESLNQTVESGHWEVPRHETRPAVERKPGLEPVLSVATGFERSLGARCACRGAAQFRPFGHNRGTSSLPRSLALPYMPQRSAAVCTGVSHSSSIAGSAAQTVIEHPAISSDVT